MTVACPICHVELEVRTFGWHPNDPRTVHAADRVLDEHEMLVHW